MRRVSVDGLGPRRPAGDPRPRPTGGSGAAVIE